jgi:torulene dioxygenase
VELAVTGHIPAYAAGVLYRTGPGKSQIQAENGDILQLSHWFDGFSQTHRFQIKAADESMPSTRVFYNSRFSTDELVEELRETGNLDKVSFGQKRDPCKSILGKVQSEFEPEPEPQSKPEPEPETERSPSGVNIGVTLSINFPGLDIKPGDESTSRWTNSEGIRTLYAKTDYNGFKKLDPETLEPIGLASQENLHPDLSGRLAASHARSDPVTGDMFNFNLSLGQTCTYRVFRVSASTGETTILATFDATPAYLHSLLITEDHVVLCIWNAHLNPLALEESFMSAVLPTDPSQPAIWYVIDRKHGNGLIATYESPAFFCFHTINAWLEPSKEDPTKIDVVADLVRTDSSEFLRSAYYDNLISSRETAKAFHKKRDDFYRSSITRFRLPGIPSTPDPDVKKASIDWSVCKSMSPELPTMDPKRVTQKHRYVYAVTLRGESTFSDGIMKLDCDTQQVRLWACHGQSPGEPIFVADPQGTSEDDGVLLSVVLDGNSSKSYLLCLDAKDLTELGRAKVDGAIAFGFHGQHVPTMGGMPTGDY